MARQEQRFEVMTADEMREKARLALQAMCDDDGTNGGFERSMNLLREIAGLPPVKLDAGKRMDLREVATGAITPARRATGE